MYILTDISLTLHEAFRLVVYRYNKLPNDGKTKVAQKHISSLVCFCVITASFDSLKNDPMIQTVVGRIRVVTGGGEIS